MTTKRLLPRVVRILSLGLVLLLSLAGFQPPAPVRAQADPNNAIDPALFNELRFRSVGPHRGGRVTAVAGHRRQPATFYMGATGGGVWKTTDYGVTWKQRLGRLLRHRIHRRDRRRGVQPRRRLRRHRQRGHPQQRDPGPRASTSRTTPARPGRSIGLREAGQIGACSVHPHEPGRRLTSAALGQPFGARTPSAGVFKTHRRRQDVEEGRSSSTTGPAWSRWR